VAWYDLLFEGMEVPLLAQTSEVRSMRGRDGVEFGRPVAADEVESVPVVRRA
jgi:hypothetical protein